MAEGLGFQVSGFIVWLTGRVPPTCSEFSRCLRCVGFLIGPAARVSSLSVFRLPCIDRLLGLRDLP